MAAGDGRGREAEDRPFMQLAGLGREGGGVDITLTPPPTPPSPNLRAGWPLPPRTAPRSAARRGGRRRGRGRGREARGPFGGVTGPSSRPSRRGPLGSVGPAGRGPPYLEPCSRGRAHTCQSHRRHGELQHERAGLGAGSVGVCLQQKETMVPQFPRLGRVMLWSGRNHLGFLLLYQQDIYNGTVMEMAMFFNVVLR